MAKIYLKPTPRTSAVKISELKNLSAENGQGTQGKVIKKTKILPHCSDTITPLYNKNIGGLNTGLNVDDDNPFFETTDALPQEFEYLRTKKKAILQEILECKHDRPKGFYTNRMPRREDKERTFFQDFKIQMKDMTNILDTTNPHDELAYYVLKASKYVAGSEVDWKNGKKPEALYYISDEKEEQDKIYKREFIKSKALGLLTTNEITPEMMRKFIKYLRNTDKDSKLPQGNTSNETAFLTLKDYVKDLNGAKTFLDAHDLFTKSAPGRQRFEAIVLLQQLLEAYIVSNRGETYTWNSTKIVIGNRKEEVIQFLLNPEKGPEVEDLEKELQAKYSIV
jgi:hypothetical protein